MYWCGGNEATATTKSKTMTTKYTVTTATKHIESLIKDLQDKVANLNREQCEIAHKKLTDYAKEIDFWKNPNKESGKKYMQFMKSLDQNLLDGYHDFAQIDLYNLCLEKGLHVCTSWTKQGKPMYPQGALKAAGFDMNDGVYIF